MLHRRIHERNREIAIESFKIKDTKGSPVLSRNLPSSSPELGRDSSIWRDRSSARSRVLSIRGRIDARRIRARSRWESVSQLSKFGDNSLSI